MQLHFIKKINMTRVSVKDKSATKEARVAWMLSQGACSPAGATGVLRKGPGGVGERWQGIQRGSEPVIGVEIQKERVQAKE